jgi:hypothetical protein
MKGFVYFLARPVGRFLRLFVGFGLIMGAWLTLSGTSLYVALAIGAVMMLAAFADVCLLAPLVGLSINDELLRDQSSRQQHLL